MAAILPYGVVNGNDNSLVCRWLPVSKDYGAAVTKGDLVYLDAGYLKPCADNATICCGVAVSAHAAPDAEGDDGQFDILVCIDARSVIRVPVGDAGTGVALVGEAVDIGGAQEVDLTQNQSVLRLWEYDSVEGIALVSLIDAKRA